LANTLYRIVGRYTKVLTRSSQVQIFAFLCVLCTFALEPFNVKVFSAKMQRAQRRAKEKLSGIFCNYTEESSLIYQAVDDAMDSILHVCLSEID